MKETLRRKITVTSSFNEVSKDPMGKMGGGEGRKVLLRPHLSTSRLQDRYLKTT
jgi:hypothetical protein